MCRSGIILSDSQVQNHSRTKDVFLVSKYGILATVVILLILRAITYRRAGDTVTPDEHVGILHEQPLLIRCVFYFQLKPEHTSPHHLRQMSEHTCASSWGDLFRVLSTEGGYWTTGKTSETDSWGYLQISYVISNRFPLRQCCHQIFQMM